MTSDQLLAPRIGVTWRTAEEEVEGKRDSYDAYLRAVRKAGGDPVEISLRLAASDLTRLAESLDGVVLSGSPMDVRPQRFHAPRGPKTTPPDTQRENTDDFLLEHAVATGKPVLAICFGEQLLNVHFGGSLVQDISTDLVNSLDHSPEATSVETLHPVLVEGGQLADLAGKSTIEVNSSHHQSVLEPGQGLRVTGRAPDGVVEALEWTGGPAWIMGVQWHPERMVGDPLAEGLFSRLVGKARDARRGRERSSLDIPSTLARENFRSE